ncbi:MAG: antiviral reverse transcriptase Drt3b [Phenylobacterium sp.]|uniref:antiviral reverse transcriptase Drt3b n=1 Tax=Phenylobacterium sp. TaxID=1871053 RepID=UPI0027343D29|nr:antiviral reverse transcriptase Drt3b [Phenylobacterium sp.]MDP3749712.1 antiviral reverse transcriptase Drt3b [Phenylobacterium sp.]
MKRRKVRLQSPRQRSVLSDTLPYEVPPTFSNRHFFVFLSKHEVEFGENKLSWTCADDSLDQTMRLLFGFGSTTPIDVRQAQQWGKSKSVREVPTDECRIKTKPFSFKISHKESEARTLSICHPRNQVRVAEFYRRYHPLIIYYAGLSPFSLRKPSEIAKISYFKDRLHFENLEILPPKAVEQYNEEYDQLGSYFRYRRFNNIHKFFESPIYHRAEMEFDAMLQMDVSKCFDSIYTHSLSWSLIGKQATKDDIPASRKTFGGAFDELMQQTNDAETNGIIIGPEFSRIFAELVMQSVDVAVEQRLLNRAMPLTHRRDYKIFRYVDDYFIFYNREEDGHLITQVLGECLAEVKLAVNSSKTVVYRKPIITEITVAKDRISTLFNDLLTGELTQVAGPAAGSEEHAETDAVIYKYQISLNESRMIVKYKTILKETGASYKDILNYSFSIIENKVEGILRDYCLAASEERSAKGLAYALVAIIQFVFFLYAASPRVNHTIRTCRIVGTITTFLEGNDIGSELKHLVYKVVHENIAHHLRKHKVTEFREIECLYLLVSLAELGRDYRLSEAALAEYFGFTRDGPGYVAQEGCAITFFSITVGLHYMGPKRRYERLRQAMEVYALDRLNARRGYCGHDAESLLLTFDLISCPFVDPATKLQAGQLYDLDQAGVDSIAAASPQWFTTWSEFDLQMELDAKRSRNVY